MFDNENNVEVLERQRKTEVLNKSLRERLVVHILRHTELVRMVIEGVMKS